MKKGLISIKDSNLPKTLPKRMKTRVKGKIRKIQHRGAYFHKVLVNSIKPHGKKQVKGRELYIFGPDGTKIGTVENFLKNAFRSTRASPSESKRKQNPKTFEKKVRLRDEENRNIREVRRRSIDQKKVIREIRRSTKTLRKYERQAKYKTWSDEQRAEASNLAGSVRQKIRKLQKERDRIQNRKRNHSIRIVKMPGTAKVSDIQTHLLYPIRSEPGKPPKTNPNGKPLKKGIFIQETENGFIIFAGSNQSKNAVFRELEHGATVNRRERGDLIGYAIQEGEDSGRNYSHKRVGLKKIYEKKGSRIKFKPRPFFEPVRELLQAEILKLTASDFNK